jgi:hypothetical protein
MQLMLTYHQDCIHRPCKIFSDAIMVYMHTTIIHYIYGKTYLAMICITQVHNMLPLAAASR